MNHPPLLKSGDQVSVVAPCGTFDRGKFEVGLTFLEEAGLKPVFRPDVFAGERYLAGSDQRRSEELAEALRDQHTRAIWVARGGYGATRLLPYLDLEAVRRANKWLIGFSDVTALHCVWARAGLMSIHGANVTTLPEWSPVARAELFSLLLTGRGQPFDVKNVGTNNPAAIGVLAGGNLTVLAALAGTGFLPPWRDRIVLFEDVGERPYRLDRTLTQLKQVGAFIGVAGFVIGQLTQCGEGTDPSLSPSDKDALAAVLDVLVPLGVPVATALGVGHEPTSRPAMLGATATIGGQTMTLDICG